MFQMIRRRPITAVAPPNEVPESIYDTLDLNRLFYFRNSRKILPWFGFFQSSTHTIIYLILNTFLLIGVMKVLVNFEIYEEFKSMPYGFALVFAGAPYMFLFISHTICALTFSLTGIDDKLLSFVEVRDRDSPEVVDNLPQRRLFNSEFSSKISSFRGFILGFTLVAIVFRVYIDFCRMSQQANTFYCVYLIALWCYLSMAFVLGNGLIYIAAVSCKVHVSIYKDLLNESISNIRTLYWHYQRLRLLVKRFSQKFSWYLVSQVSLCIMSLYFTLMIMYGTYMSRAGVFMLGAADFMCWIVMEIPLFWGILFVLNDLRLQMVSIHEDVVERGELCQLVSNRPELASKWERIADYIQYNTKGVHISYREVDSSLVLFFGLQFTLVILLLGIAISYSILNT